MHTQLRFSLAVFAIVATTIPSMAQTGGDGSMSAPASTGRVAVNGVELYYEIRGKGLPLVMLHGGVNPSDMFGAPLDKMAETNKVIAVHLRGHGFSTDEDEPWTYQQMADDVAALLDKLEISKADFMGWSLGGGVALQTAIRHPERVGKLVVISMNIRAGGNFPEIQAEFDTMPNKASEYAKGIEGSDLARKYPDIDWTAMMRKTGEMNRGNYDWSADVAKIRSPTLLMFADADMMYLEHIVEFYKLLGGGAHDAGIDGSKRPTANQLAIIPGTTHYNLMLTATESATAYAKAFLAQ